MTILDKFFLGGKVVVITGGSGLYGRQLTAAIAEAGATVIIASRNLEKLNAEALSHRNRGFDVTAELLDLSDERSIIALHDRLVKRHGKIDGLVNNSVLRPMQKLDDSVQAWEDSLKVNATGLFLISRAIGNAMKHKEGGSIVNIGSIQGMVGPSAELYKCTDMGMPPPDYFFHKGGMINLTRYFAAVLGPKNIRVNCVSAGGFYNHQPEPFLSQYKCRTMLGRMAGNDDLAGVVVFLLGDASGYITGANIAVDGGYTAK